MTMQHLPSVYKVRLKMIEIEATGVIFSDTISVYKADHT